MTDPALTAVAFHEAGHVITAMALGIPFHLVTVRPTAAFAGALYFTAAQVEAPKFDPCARPLPRPCPPEHRHLLEREVMVMFGGPVAQAGHQRRFDFANYAADLDDAQRYATAAVRGRAGDGWLMFVWCQTVDLLTTADNWYAIEAVAAALLDRGTMVEADVRDVTNRARERFDMKVQDRLGRASSFLHNRRPALRALWPTPRLEHSR